MSKLDYMWVDFLNLPKDPVNSCPRDCDYLSRLNALVYCNYLEITGHPRGCKAGKGCTKYHNTSKGTK